MIKVTSWPDGLIDVSTAQGWENGHPIVEVSIRPGTRFLEMVAWYEIQKKDQELREKNPILDDAWHQYETIKALIKANDK
jgi:antitoxin component YwqK of YwqJK toxin-antitoxin module